VIEIGARLQLGQRCLALVIGYYSRNIIARGAAGGARFHHDPIGSSFIKPRSAGSPAAQNIDEPRHVTATTRQTSQAPILLRLPTADAAGWYHIVASNLFSLICLARRLNSTTSCRRVSQ
jgi:hypothetical protein